jgi:tape measure domain-containing protein
MGALADEYIRIRPDVSRMPREIRNAGVLAGKNFSDSFASRAKGLIKGGLVATGLAAGTLFAAALKKGFGRLSAIEDAEAKLTGLGHSAKSVDKIMVNALASVKGTAFGLDEAATLAATAVAAGIKPGQELERTLKLVADAATIGGTSLSEMGAIFNQVAASNKVQGDTINQLNERGIPILKLLADVMGKSQGEVAELASKGEVDFATFQKAMEKGLGGAALKSGKTASGAFKNMGAAFSRVGAALLKDVFPKIGEGIGGITSWLDDITPVAERIGRSWGKALQSEAFKTAVADLKEAVAGLTGNEDLVQSLEDMAGALPKIVSGLATAITKYTEFATLVDKFENKSFGEGDKVGGPVGQIVKDFGTGGTIERALIQFRGFVATHVGQAWAKVKEAFGRVAADIIGTWNSVRGGTATAWNAITGVVSAAWPRIKGAVATGVSAVASFLKSALNLWLLPFRLAFTAIGTILVLAWQAMKAVTAAAFGFIKDKIITPIWDRIGGKFMTVMRSIAAAWRNWWSGLKAVGSAIFSAISSFVSGVWNRIRSRWIVVQVAVRAAWAAFWGKIKSVGTAVFNAIASFVSGVWNRIRSKWTGAQTGVSSSWSSFWGKIKSVGGAAIDWVRSKIATVLDKIKSAFSTAKTNIKKTWDGVKSVVSTPITWIKDNVYNKPLVPVWNRVADLVSGPKLSAYAEGGPIRGPRKGRDNVLGLSRGGSPTAWVEPGEWVAPRWMSPMFPWLEDVRKQGREGLPAAMPGLQGGGVVGWFKGLASSATGKISDLAGKLKGWVLGGLHSLAEKLLNPIKDAIGKAMPNSGVGQTVGGIGKKAINLVLDKIKTDDLAAMAATSGAPGGSIGTVSRGMAATIGALRAAGAQSFTTYPGHHPSMAKARDVTPHNWSLANIARASSSVWYVIYRMMIASKNHGNSWRTYHPDNHRGDWRHERHIHVGFYDQGGILKPGLNLAYNGTGRDELVAPISRGTATITRPRPITILIDLGDGLTQKVQGVIDDNDEFRATVGRTR